jgi:hypothetical protein
MGLATIFQDALDAIKTAHPDLVVAVVIGGVAGTGTRDTRTDVASLVDNGEVGGSSGRVRVNSDDFTKPENGATITVGSDSCFIGDVQTDGAGAFYVISYQLQKPK